MRKMLVLLAVTMLISSTSGCGICRRMRDALCRGSICSSMAAPAPRPIAVAPVMVAPTVTAVDPGCNFDPGCSYSGVESLGYSSTPMELDCGYSGGVMSAPMQSGSAGTMVLPPDPGPMGAGS